MWLGFAVLGGTSAGGRGGCELRFRDDVRRCDRCLLRAMPLDSLISVALVGV